MEKGNVVDLNLKLLAVIGLVCTVLFAEIVIVVQANVYSAQEDEATIRQIGQPSAELRELTLAQQAELNSYRWVDREKQRVSIPIEHAMALFVQQEQQRAATRPAR